MINTKHRGIWAAHTSSHRVAPVAIGLYQGYQVRYSFLLGDILLHALLAFIEANSPDTSTYITIIGIGHLARPVYYTPHYANLQVRQV